MKKALLILLALSLLLCCALGCKETSELRTVELHEVTRSVFYAPQYVAISKGYFAEEGLEINITTSGGSDKAMTALLSGQADVCLAGPETGVYVYNEGKADYPVIVAQLTKRDGSFLLGHEAEANFKWESLRGKTVIGGRPGGMPMMALLYVLEQNGLTPGVDVEVIDSVQFNLMGGAFEGGMGDYVTLFEPTATEFELAGKGSIVANVGIASGEVPYTVYLVRQETLHADADLIERFVRAIYKAQRWITTASDAEIAEAMQPFFPDSSSEILVKVVKNYRETDSWKTNPEMLEPDYERLLALMEGAGELSARPPFAELIRNDIAREVIG